MGQSYEPASLGKLFRGLHNRVAAIERVISSASTGSRKATNQSLAAVGTNTKVMGAPLSIPPYGSILIANVYYELDRVLDAADTIDLRSESDASGSWSFTATYLGGSTGFRWDATLPVRSLTGSSGGSSRIVAPPSAVNYRFVFELVNNSGLPYTLTRAQVNLITY